MARITSCGEGMFLNQFPDDNSTAVLAPKAETAIEDLHGAVDRVEPRHPDPYSVSFPDLTVLTAGREIGRRLKICIATEDIYGPIRNGGIGTTYTHLAYMLADQGHDTTIFYLRGDHSETGTVEHWVDHYAERGVSFVPLDPDQPNCTSIAPRWLNPMYSLYERLKKEQFDLVHASEWRGLPYLCLLAKSQGLAFQDTVFCVKASSPWLWNREHGLHTISQLTDLPKMIAERRSIEMADLVVGGSQHLLCWMLDHGYKLPEDRTFVQPNVVVPISLPGESRNRRIAYGERVKVDEIVFFGRLEYRKGLHIFCDAMDILIREGQARVPSKITFMGKYGQRIPTHPDTSIPDYIRLRAANWPIEWKILDSFGQEEAITYLLGDERLAVMPSIIENSSLTIYETTYYGIPFVASDCGGNPELVHRADRDEVLTKPHPVPLSEKLAEALNQGGLVARPSFDNEANLAVWREFHEKAATSLNIRKTTQIAKSCKVSVCLTLTDDISHCRNILERLEREESSDLEVVLVVNGGDAPATQEWLRTLELSFNARGWILERNASWGETACLNYAARLATGELLLFYKEGTYPKPNSIRTYREAALHSRAEVLCCLYDEVKSVADMVGTDGEEEPALRRRALFLASDHTLPFFGPEWAENCFAVRAATFARLGGFREDYGIPGAEAEFLAMARLANCRIDTLPEALVWKLDGYRPSGSWNFDALAYRTIRPYIEAAPECYRQLLMTARGGAAAGSRYTRGDSLERLTLWGHRRDLFEPLTLWGHSPSIDSALETISQNPRIHRTARRIYRSEWIMITAALRLQELAIRLQARAATRLMQVQVGFLKSIGRWLS